MPSKRKTISELELIDEIIGSVLRKRTEGHDNEPDYEAYLDWKAGASEKPESIIEADKHFDVARKARRAIATQEMKKIRKELLPTGSRREERDRVRRALTLHRKDSLRTQDSKWLEFTKGLTDNKSALDIEQELLKRKVSPLMRLVDQRSMSRRDLFRMGRGGAAKLAEMTPAGQMVKAAVAKESPLFVKFVKALLSRQFHY